MGIAMCKLLNWVDEKVKKFRWFDISLIKLATFSIALLIAKLFPVMLSLDWYVYLIIAILASVRGVYVMLRKE